MIDLLSSPPVALCVYLTLAYLLYRVGGWIGARGKEEPGKHEPYACGEALAPPDAQLDYHSFFHLALMFGILHLAALVLSTLPAQSASHRLATVYLVGIGVSVFVLTRSEI
jgi:NADH:ubiquinone oxidoreductase subunit 3 (subunit A)